MGGMKGSSTVIVFDFDLTIIDCDSDPWVIEQLGATPLFQALLPTLPWNPLMDKMMGELHDQGKTISDIEQSLKTIPLYPETIRAIKFAFSMGCELRIVSDAKTILQAHDLLQYFTEINTNPTFVDEKGRLRIQPFHPFTEGFPHGCSLCPPNMCKDKMMGELHDQGKTISDIEQSLKTIPLYPETIRAIKFAFSMGCELRIVSDANMFFIKTILQAHDLLQYFTEINTNPAFVDEKGRLRIQPFHPFTEGPPHGCSLCPPNMCKGAVIDEIMRKSLEKQIIYLGDGSGDFCPSLKLRDGDHVLPRKEYPLWKLIQKNRDLVKAEVHEWSNAKDVEDLFVKLLKP